MTTRKLDAHAGGGGDSPTGYLHGYSAAERDRLQRQARFLEPLVHDRLPYRRKRKLLEVGSGVGLRDVVTGVKTMHLDNREPVERAETLAYWSDLLLSGKELARAARDPNCVFFYAFIQARARAW